MCGFLIVIYEKNKFPVNVFRELLKNRIEKNKYKENKKMKFKSLIMVLIMFVTLLAFTNESKAQYFNSSISSTQDTVTVAGSTDAGSRWFTKPAGKFKSICIEVFVAGYWSSYEINYPDVNYLGNLRFYWEGGDSTLRVQSDMGGAYVQVPIVVGTNSSALSVSLTATGVVRIRGIK